MEIPTRAKSGRCAIYTRKSAEPPLGQEVTSLESQRAICEAYVCSQQHKGWTLIDKPYDDAGRSGATLVRPALQDLMTDIDAGRVDIVLVYKLDRITRTLLDFVRLIDFFDRYGVAFVSITQNFDTSDSMGRLIRNILLTFAQFEREIASDRIRDKKMVMRERGLWIGGNAPLGYTLRKGKLLVNPREAEAVRCIFTTYVEQRSIAAVHRQLLAGGYRRDAWRSQTGQRHPPAQISISSLHHILRNPAYVGETASRGERFPGIHAPIIARDLWDRAQQVLKEREQFKPRQPGHLLTGLLFDAFGRRMHARIFNRHPASRYYESATLSWAEDQGIRPIRLQADQAERLVLSALGQLLADRMRIRPLLMQLGITGLSLDRLSQAAGAAAVRLDRLPVPRLSAALKVLIERVEVALDAMRLLVRLEALARFLAWDGVGIFASDPLDAGPATLHLVEVPVAATRERRRSWLPIEPCLASGSPSPALIGLLEDADAAFKLVFAHRDVPISDLARSLGRKTGSFSRLLRLRYLAPDIIAAIRDGKQPDGLDRRQLLECDLPMDWALQRRLLGFPARQEAWSRSHHAQAPSLGGEAAAP